jgi:hypothetical protein
MDNPDFIELFQNTKAQCENCPSKNLLLFVETNIKNCVAWACFDCKHFEIRGDPKVIKDYFKNKNVAK